MSLAAVRRLGGMTTTTATFTGIHTVAIPVTDQDRTQALLEGLGFQTRFDAELQPGFRWIELAPPGAATSIAVVEAGEELPTGVDTGIRLITPDARVAHDQLRNLGLAVGDLLDWESVPLMFSFEDYDGNRLYVSEPSQR
jgi:catechol 2,3-dioxygenase-like lactoylglutathione lyase family enzyme